MAVVTTQRANAPQNTPIILAQSAVPVALAPNGTVATNGAITLVTALPTTYSGGAWVRLPAGAVVGGLAGLYWCVFSSTTVGAVKTNFIDPANAFTPYIPSGALVAAVGSNAAYTQTTGADITLANITVPGGAMGSNGSIRTFVRSSYIKAAGNKNIKTFWGSDLVITSAGTTSGGCVQRGVISNRGVTNSQQTTTDLVATGLGFSGYSALDTTADQSVGFALHITAGTDFHVLEAFTVEVLPS